MKNKVFDCLAMKSSAQQIIGKELSELTQSEKLAYYQDKLVELKQKQEKLVADSARVVRKSA